MRKFAPSRFHDHLKDCAPHADKAICLPTRCRTVSVTKGTLTVVEAAVASPQNLDNTKNQKGQPNPGGKYGKKSESNKTVWPAGSRDDPAFDDKSIDPKPVAGCDAKEYTYVSEVDHCDGASMTGVTSAEPSKDIQLPALPWMEKKWQGAVLSHEPTWSGTDPSGTKTNGPIRKDNVQFAFISLRGAEALAAAWASNFDPGRRGVRVFRSHLMDLPTPVRAVLIGTEVSLWRPD